MRSHYVELTDRQTDGKPISTVERLIRNLAIIWNMCVLERTITKSLSILPIGIVSITTPSFNEIG